MRDLAPVEIEAKAAKAKTIGRNKSGMIWKKGTSAKSSLLNKSVIRKSWEQRIVERSRHASLKARMDEVKAERIAEK